jgi:hypothetical protein
VTLSLGLPQGDLSHNCPESLLSRSEGQGHHTIRSHCPVDVHSVASGSLSHGDSTSPPWLPDICHRPLIPPSICSYQATEQVSRWLAVQRGQARGHSGRETKAEPLGMASGFLGLLKDTAFSKQALPAQTELQVVKNLWGHTLVRREQHH